MAAFLTARAGHWTGDGTGVTVIVPPPGTIASGEVRGGAPATREFELLSPVRTVDRIDAVVLSGGSAFGLAAADGVMGALRERARGFATPFGPVPIVVGMSLFDASVAGDPPGAAEGRAAFAAALADGPLMTGAVGAGAGATTGKWRSRLDPGGIGTAVALVDPRAVDPRAGGPRPGDPLGGGASVAAIVAVNAWGDVLGGDGSPLFAPDAEHVAAPAPFGLTNTTIGVLVTDAALSKADCFLLAQSGHTGLARALHPAHSRHDGDAVVALSTGTAAGADRPRAGPHHPRTAPAVPGHPRAATVDLDRLRAVAAEVMAAAIRNAVAR